MISPNDAKYSLAVLLTACAALLVQISCSSTSKMAKPLSDFSAATSDTTTVTTSALSVVQSADQDAVVIKAAAAKLTSLKEKDVPAFFHPNDLLQRQLALQALTTYAATLKTLSGVDRSADIQKSFASLKTSIDSTVATINKLNTDSKTQIPSGVVSGLVSLGSNLVIAYAAGQRDKAIRTALEKGDSAVTKICSLLAAELGPPHGGIYDQLQNDYRVQEEAADVSFRAITNPPAAEGDSKPRDASKGSATLKPSDLASSIKTFLGLNNKKEYSLALLGSLASSYRKIAQAHTALKLQSETGAKSDIQLRALSSEIDNVKFLYSQISK